MKDLIMLLLLTVFLVSCSLSKPVAATSNPVGNKVGTSSATTVFGITVDGDASVLSAARNAGITKISTVDFTNKNILFIYQRHTCTVSGE